MQAGKAVLVLSEDVEGEALATLVVNKIRGTFAGGTSRPRLRRSSQGDAPGHRDPHRRTGDLRGGRPEARERHDRPAGHRRKVVVNSDETTIVEGGGKDEDIKGRINQIESEIEKTTPTTTARSSRSGWAKLSGGVAVIKVGAATEVELKEKKHRIEDAVQSTKAAVEEGIVARRRRAPQRPGRTGQGGSRGRRAHRRHDRPARAGGAAEADRGQRRPPGRCRSRRSVRVGPRPGTERGHRRIRRHVQGGVVDPAKVTRSALQNAASIAALFLTTEAVVAEKPEKEGRSRHAWRRRHGLLTRELRRSIGTGAGTPRSASGPGLRPARSVPCTAAEVEIPIRWRDVDAYGHVNNAVFLTCPRRRGSAGRIALRGGRVGLRDRSRGDRLPKRAEPSRPGGDDAVRGHRLRDVERADGRACTPLTGGWPPSPSP